MFKQVRSHLSNLYRRWQFPQGISPRKGLQAQEVLTRYIAAPEDFWHGPRLRHAEKIR